MMTSFSDQVGAFARQTEARMEAVWRDAVQRTVASMQQPVGSGGNMPIDTGFLRNSILGAHGTNPAAGVTFKPDVGVFSYDASQINLTIATAKLSEGVSVIYLANYAIYVEYGARGHPARRFVAQAAQRWPEFVRRANNELEKVAGRG
jgi:hypothetical protein